MAGRGAVAGSHLEDVAGRGAEAERMAGSAMAKRMAALWQRAIGKILLAGAPRSAEWRRCVQSAAREKLSTMLRYCPRENGRQKKDGPTNADHPLNVVPLC